MPMVVSKGAHSTSLSRSRRPIAFTLLAAILCGASLAAFWQKTLIDAAVRFLVDPDVPGKANLIYVLGGNYSVRAPAAAALFRKGWAPKVLLVREPDEEAGKENFTDTTSRILVESGVPRDRIIEFSPGSGVRSTSDEARALRLYLNVYPAAKVLVVTSAFHSRRARMALTRAIPRGVRILMVTAKDNDCGVDTWRDSPFCRHQVETEWMKLLFYFFTFFG